jgi:hypothetical protein
MISFTPRFILTEVYLGADGFGLTGDPKNPSPSKMEKEHPKGLANFEIAPAKEESPW